MRTRNYFTHWNRRLEARAAKGAQLFALTEATKLLLEFTLLLNLGFTKTQIQQLVDRNQRMIRDMQRSFLSL
jgi:ApeA N-terminal domain 1